MQLFRSFSKAASLPALGMMLMPLLVAATSLAANEPTPSFHIQAHRGAGIDRPENTLEAFLTSWEMGVTPEADLRTTADGVVVCFHDPNLKRVVSNAEADEAGQGIEQLDSSRVQELEVGSFRGQEFAGQKVPLLTNVFAVMRGKPERLLYLDIKTVDLDELAKLVGQAGVERQVIFTSEKHPLLQQWKEKVPESLTLLWNRGSEEQLEAKLDTLRAVDFAGITHLQIHVHVGDLASDDPFTPSSAYLQRIGDELTARGIVFQVLPWECSDERAYVQLLELGAASFATDYPEATLKAVETFRAASDDS